MGYSETALSSLFSLTIKPFKAMKVIAFKSVHKEGKEMHNNRIHVFTVHFSAHYYDKYASDPAVYKETLKRFPQHVPVSNVLCSSSFFCQMNKPKEP